MTLDHHLTAVAQRLATIGDDPGQESCRTAFALGLDGASTAKGLLIPAEHPTQARFERGRGETEFVSVEGQR